MQHYVNQWEFPSKSNPDKKYKVSLTEDGKYICGCWPFLRNRDQPCSHIQAVINGQVDPITGTPFEKEIVLAAVPQVMLKGTCQVYTPLIPIDDTHFQATVLFDLLRAGISWATLRQRYGLAQKNPKDHIIAYIEQRGRKVVDKMGRFNDSYKIIAPDLPLPEIKDDTH